jgi:hypothetical protein
VKAVVPKTPAERLYSSQRLDFAILEEVDLSNFLQHSRKLALSGK